MADDVNNINVNIITCLNFLEFQKSAVLKAVEFDDAEEDSNCFAVMRTAATSASDNIPVRIEGYSEFIVPRYAEIAFKEHFRMNRSTFEVVDSLLVS